MCNIRHPVGEGGLPSLPLWQVGEQAIHSWDDAPPLPEKEVGGIDSTTLGRGRSDL